MLSGIRTTAIGSLSRTESRFMDTGRDDSGRPMSTVMWRCLRPSEFAVRIHVWKAAGHVYRRIAHQRQCQRNRQHVNQLAACMTFEFSRGGIEIHQAMDDFGGSLGNLGYQRSGPPETRRILLQIRVGPQATGESGPVSGSKGRKSLNSHDRIGL